MSAGVGITSGRRRHRITNLRENCAGTAGTTLEAVIGASAVAIECEELIEEKNQRARLQ